MGFLAILGITSLIGVIVSHVIVLFDFIEEQHERGESLRDALIDAGIRRIRPVLITVGATVLALFPLALHGGPLWQALADRWARTRDRRDALYRPGLLRGVRPRSQDRALEHEGMTILIVLFGALGVLRVLGFAGVGVFASWLSCARAALAAMFVFTAVSHFTPMRKDPIAMVPPSPPCPDLLVSLTGAAELAGAIGLLIPAVRFWAASALILLLLLMLPANISAARRGVLLRGRRPTPLWIRVPMQGLLVGWAWIVR
jgi:uncharacterized membrane protein